ncbi:MAG: hypothetical protein GYB49_05120 [Alphaproteobacteria bacterium]|nr:hypothetical protein [Alphaproteobacteria bacterium]
MDRPIIYLDQNILGEPLEALIASNQYAYWKDTFYIGYSDETLVEIARAEMGADRFLSNLEKLQTVHIHPNMEGFEIKEGYLLKLTPPRLRFRELSLTGRLMDETTVLNVAHKLYGGQPDKTYPELLGEQIDAMGINWNMDLEALDLSAAQQSAFGDLLREILRLIRSGTAEAAQSMQEQTSAYGSGNPLADFRKEVVPNLEAINDIEGDNIVRRIAEELQKSNAFYSKKGVEEIFNLNGKNSVTGRPLDIVEKARNIMLMLNWFGYKADKRLKREDKFKSSSSDLVHAGYGSLCHAIVTRDKGFKARLQATYQFLELRTSVLSVDLENGLKFVD